MDAKKLDPRPARELTSREVSKILGGMLGGLANLAPPETLFAALDFFIAEKYQTAHETVWRAVWDAAVASRTGSSGKKGIAVSHVLLEVRELTQAEKEKSRRDFLRAVMQRKKLRVFRIWFRVVRGPDKRAEFKPRWFTPPWIRRRIAYWQKLNALLADLAGVSL